MPTIGDHDDAAESATVTYVYDTDGELTDTTDADGRRTTYSYDADGDQTGETWVGARPSRRSPTRTMPTTS